MSGRRIRAAAQSPVGIARRRDKKGSFTVLAIPVGWWPLYTLAKPVNSAQNQSRASTSRCLVSRPGVLPRRPNRPSFGT